MKLAGLVLAAGDGSRLGRPKAEIVVGGRRLVDLAVESCVRAGLSPVVVVLGAVLLTPMPLAERPDGDAAEVRLVENADWATGMASSLQAGLAWPRPLPDTKEPADGCVPTRTWSPTWSALTSARGPTSTPRLTCPTDLI